MLIALSSVTYARLKAMASILLAEQVRNNLLDCAVELSPKTPVYAALVGEPLFFKMQSSGAPINSPEPSGHQAHCGTSRAKEHPT